MTYEERIAAINKNRRDYKLGLSTSDIEGCAINGFVPDWVYDKALKGRVSIRVACQDIDFLLARIAALEVAMGEAIESLHEWGEYVDAYFKAKHDFNSDIDRLTAVKEGRE